MLTDILGNIILGDIASLLLQPVGQPNPLVLFLLQSTCLLNLVNPSLRIAGLHLYLVKAGKGIGYEGGLVRILRAEH